MVLLIFALLQVKSIQWIQNVSMCDISILYWMQSYLLEIEKHCLCTNLIFNSLLTKYF